VAPFPQLMWGVDFTACVVFLFFLFLFRTVVEMAFLLVRYLNSRHKLTEERPLTEDNRFNAGRDGFFAGETFELTAPAHKKEACNRGHLFRW